MIVNPKIYTHESDEAALKALQAIPVFSQLLKAFMKVWSEKQFALQNMSSNLRLGENQLPKYYNMLPPICEKLGIPVPELYLEHNVNPNAYTSGDTNPFIVITSGLIETLPDELIPTVLAHECGHIACHHVLYQTMGRMLLNGTLMGLNLIGIPEAAIIPLKLAFFHWMRCAEFSADRAAAICDGSAENMVRVCMAFAGFDKDICGEANVEAFLEQAVEYKKMVSDDKLNRALEFMMFMQETHPLVAVRAYECNEWCKKEDFESIIKLANCKDIVNDTSVLLPMLKDGKNLYGENIDDVRDYFVEMGFNNVEIFRLTEVEKKLKKGEVVDITTENTVLTKGMWLSANSRIIISYYEPKTEEEISAEHSDEIKMPNSSKHYQGMHYKEVLAIFQSLGFTEILCDEKQDLKKGWLVKPGSVQHIYINGEKGFEKGDWIRKDIAIHIVYRSN